MKSASNLVRDDPRGLSIRNRLRFLVKDSAVFGGGAALSKAFGLIPFPLVGRPFPVADYGLIDFYAVLGVLITIFLIFGQDSAVARFFYEYQDEESRCRLISQSLALQIVFMLLVLPPLWLSADLLGSELRASSEAEVLFRLVLLQVPFLVL